MRNEAKRLNIALQQNIRHRVSDYLASISVTPRSFDNIADAVADHDNLPAKLFEIVRIVLANRPKHFVVQMNSALIMWPGQIHHEIQLPIDGNRFQHSTLRIADIDLLVQRIEKTRDVGV